MGDETTTGGWGDVSIPSPPPEWESRWALQLPDEEGEVTYVWRWTGDVWEEHGRLRHGEGFSLGGAEVSDHDGETWMQASHFTRE